MKSEERRVQTKNSQGLGSLFLFGATSDKVSEPTTSPSWRRVCAVASKVKIKSFYKNLCHSNLYTKYFRIS